MPRFSRAPDSFALARHAEAVALDNGIPFSDVETGITHNAHNLEVAVPNAYYAVLSDFSAAERDFIPLIAAGVLSAHAALEAEFPGCSVEAEEDADAGAYLVTLSPEMEAKLESQGYIDEERGGLRLQIELA